MVKEKYLRNAYSSNCAGFTKLVANIMSSVANIIYAKIPPYFQIKMNL